MASSIWRRKFRIPWTLSMVMSVCMLVWLNSLTAGVGEGEDCSWSLFGVWAEQIRYIRESSTPLYDVWYLITGGGSVGLWLYTFLHVVPAVILGWTLAGIISAVWMLIKWKAKGNGA